MLDDELGITFGSHILKLEKKRIFRFQNESTNSPLVLYLYKNQILIYMGNLKYIVLIMAFGLFSCSSQKKLQTETPFEMGSASCQEYVGGKEESGKGMMLSIPVTMGEENMIELNEVFFRGKQVSVTMQEKDGMRFAVARIPNAKGGSAEAVALKLESTEAILSYTDNGKVKYTKITDIKQKQPLIHNSIKKN
jgi:hypothetical protein